MTKLCTTLTVDEYNKSDINFFIAIGIITGLMFAYKNKNKIKTK